MGSSTTQKAPYQGSGICETFTITAGAWAACDFTFDKTVDSSIEGHPLKKNVKISLTNKINNEAYNTWLKAHLTSVDVVQNKVTYEDGVVETVNGGVSAANKFGVIWYDGTVGAKVRVVFGVAVASGATGNTKTVYGNIGDMPVEITLVDNGAAITILATAFNASIVSGAAQVVLASGDVGCVLFLTAA